MEDTQAIATLVRRCTAGDSAAWEELVRLYNRRIYNICYRFTSSSEDAQDLTQEVFIRIFRTLNSYDAGKGAFNTWLTTMTRNLLVDHFRRRKQDRMTDSLEATQGSEGEGPTLGEQLADPGPTPHARVLSREAQEKVQKGLQRLSPELREAVILRDLHDMDYREIALLLKVPEGTVKSRINRGRTELGRLLSRTK